METKFDNPHDELAKAWFGEVSHMQHFLENALPPELSNALDYTSLQSAKETYLNPALQESICDIVFHCQTKDKQEGSVYVLFEHKSSPAHYCAVQLLRYMASIWSDAVTARKKSLPFIIPIVFYHGKGRWNGKPLKQLFPEDTPFAPYIPDFQFVLYDLSTIPEEVLKQNIRDNALLVFLHALLSDVPARKLAEAIQLLLSVARGESIQETLKLFFFYLGRVKSDVTIEVLEQELAKISPEGETTMQNIWDQISERAFNSGIKKGEARGEAKGKAEGIKEGMEQGIEQGMRQGIEQGSINTSRQMLFSMLKKRFTIIPEIVSNKLNAMTDIDKLTNLATELFTVQSIEAFEALLDE